MSSFFDTNILIYAVDGRFPDKQKTALTLFADAVKSGSFVISTQVLIEFFNATTKGIKTGKSDKGKSTSLLTPQEAQMQVASLARLRVVTTTPAIVVSAVDRALQHQMHWFDALMVETALACGASILYSEDMQHGRRFGSLTLVNPFLE